MYPYVKRALDFVLSLVALILLSPVMLIIAIVIRATSPGPVFFRQKRVGLRRSHFMIYKFRTMRTDAPKDAPTHLLQNAQSFITPVGKFLRASSLDELPQLINILRGDMSFIGPRPERPEIIAQYTEVMPEFTFRMKVKAGLAGFAQVYGKYNTSPYDKLKLDLTYIENYSVWLDLKLMLLTLKVLFWPDSTEGVESEQVTAFKAEYDGRAEKDDN